MKRNAWIGIFSLVLAAGTVAIIGCNAKSDDGGSKTSSGSESSVNHVGVVDLDSVATQLGWLGEMKTNLTNMQNQLKSDLTKVQSAYEAQVAAKRKDIGIKADDKDIEDLHKRGIKDEQLQELAVMVNNGRQALYGLQQKANQSFQQYQNDWVKQYRDALAPIVRQVAQDKKILVVLNAAGPLLYADPSTDLTNAVVDAARKSPPQLHPVALPQLEVPGIDGGTVAPPTTKPATKP